MAVTIEDLLLRVRGDASGLSALPSAVSNVVSRITTQLSKAGKGANVELGAGRFVDSMGRMREANGRFVQGLGATQKGLRGVKGDLDGLAGAGFGAALAAFGLGTIDAAVRLDSLKRGLGSVATAADPVEAQLTRLREVAKLPGLGFPEAIEGSTRLQAAGLSAQLAEGALMGFGNALASVGAGKEELGGVIRALSQIQAKGKVMAEEINQIAERLPQIRPLMEAAFGTSNTEALQKMGLGSEEFITKLVEQLGTLEKVTSGPGVALENIKDAMFVMAATIGETVLPAIEAFSEMIVPVVDAAGRAFQSLPGPVKMALAGLVAVLAVAGPLSFAIGLITPAVLGAAAAIAPLGLALGLLVDMWTAVQDALSGDPARMNDAVEAYGNKLPTLIAAFGEVRDFAVMVWEEVSNVIESALATLAPIIDDAVTIALGLWAYFGDEIVTVLVGAWGVVENVLGAAVDLIAGAFRIVAALVAGDWAGAWDAFLNVVKNIAVRFTALLARMTATIFGLFQNMARLVPFIGDSIANGLASAQQQLNGFASVLEWEPGQVDLPVAVEPTVTTPAMDLGGQTFTRTPPRTRQRRTPLTDEQKDARKVADILRELPMQLAAAEARGRLFNQQLEAAEQKAQIIRTAIEGLIEHGIDPASTTVRALAAQFDQATMAADRLRTAADFEKAMTDGREAMDLLIANTETFGESWDFPAARVEVYRSMIENLRDIDPGDERIQGLINSWRLATDEAEQHARIVAQGEAFDAQEEGALSSLSAYIAATDAAQAFYEATGRGADAAASRVQALSTYLNELIAAGSDPNGIDVQETLALLRDAERVEAAANAVVSAYASMKSAAVDFGVAALSAMLGAREGTEDLGGALLGAVGALAGSLFDALGNVLIQTGITALGVGAGIQAIVQALTTLNPFVAIAAGVALVALGAVVKSSLASAASGGGGGGGGGARGGYAVGGTYGGSGRSAAAGDRGAQDSTKAVLSELQGIRSDLQAVASRPVQFTGDPREFRRAQAAAAGDARRTDVRTNTTA